MQLDSENLKLNEFRICVGSFSQSYIVEIKDLALLLFCLRSFPLLISETLQGTPK